jgi:2-oxoisovalerate dehydrogenase E1 component
MSLIREFELMLDTLKRGNPYAGIRYVHQGPAHLSIGQEAAAVGESFFLAPHDHIYGSHRSHGEVIAKGISAIEAMGEERLIDTMEGYLGGEPLRALEANLSAGDAHERAVQFLLYGLLAEIFGRKAGFNRGMGGSMHAFFPPFGIYPNNAIVGGSADIAVGSAMFKKLQQEPGIVIANIGDGSTGCGPVWEAMNFASMSQFDTLWAQPFRGHPPIIFAFIDNFYAMGGQTVGETMGYDHLARVGAGLSPTNLHTEVIDGNDPLAVADAVRRALPILIDGGGPVLLDIQCYRQSGHSPSDASAYRSREELEAWRAVDPLVEFGEKLEREGILSAEGREELTEWARERVAEVVGVAADLDASPRLDPSADSGAIGNLMFSNTVRELSEQPASDLLVSLPESTRLQSIARKQRSGVDSEGALVASQKAVTIRDALFEAIAHHLTHDQLLIAYGEENRYWDGAFGVYSGLTQLLPQQRFFNAPISEGAIVGTAIGYALEGGRALIEIMYADFLGRAGDEILNQLPKWQAMSGGLLAMPVVVRVSVGNKYGAQHSQELTSMVAQIPGLKVVFPATPYDAKGLMASALSGDDPVIFFESQRLYDTVERFHPGGVPSEYYRIPLGQPDVKRHGTDVTILSIGATLYRALSAADKLSKEFGVEAEIIDARSLVPFDYTPVVESIRKTGRILVTSDASERGSFANTLASDLQTMAFDHLDAPVVVVGARNWIFPPAEMEAYYLPQTDWLIDAVHTNLMPLHAYSPLPSSRREDLARLGL